MPNCSCEYCIEQIISGCIVDYCSHCDCWKFKSRRYPEIDLWDNIAVNNALVMQEIKHQEWLSRNKHK